MTVRVADVALDPRAGGAEAVYTYQATEDTRIGEACFVPIGNRPALGFVVDVYEATEADLGFPLARLKPLGSRVDNLNLPHQLVGMARFVAQEYLCSLAVALSPAIPPGIRERLVTAWTLLPNAESHSELTPLQKEVVQTLRSEGGTLSETPTKKLPASITRALRLLKGKGLVEQSLRMQPFAEKQQSKGLLGLTSDSQKIEYFLTHQGKKRPAQALTLMRLQTAEHACLTPAEIKALAGVTDATLRALTDEGLLVRIGEDDLILANPPSPNRYQQLAIDAVLDPLSGSEFHAFLLFGVTGSGKTEVYLRLAAEALRQGKQVLYLVPEIALATQSIAQLRERFGKSVAVLHSDLPPRERLENWTRIRNGDASVVLGARSALFAPLSNLGLIIMDEEHEASYKQESAPRYHSKSLALFLAREHKCPLVLGSATPSIESFYEAEKEILTLLPLPERAASATLPVVHIQDLTDGYKQGKPAILTPDLHDRVDAVLGRGEQAILFLNRRAYAPFVICRDCGHQMICPNCAVSLSLHRRDNKLRCHHCGFSTRTLDKCPKCQGTRLNSFGVGTEKVEESVKAEFPNARVARLDRDIARRKGAMEAVLAAFRGRDLDILVGTQMVAKGLDFPNVTLVGVIAADVSLNLPDFRSSERTFQLLAQVAGRAGRGTTRGNVVVQTFNPFHKAVLTAQNHDYPAFYEAVLEEREAAGYPPYKRLVNIVASGEGRTSVVEATEEVAERLKAIPFLEVLGPVDCALERIQNRWRRHVLVKMPPETPPSVIGEALLGLTVAGPTVVVDVDPYSLM